MTNWNIREHRTIGMWLQILMFMGNMEWNVMMPRPNDQSRADPDEHEHSLRKGKGKVHGKRGKWFGNWIEQNGPDIMKDGVVRRILSSDMCMFRRTHGKLWRIWDHRHRTEWMIHYEGYGGSCSVWNGTEPQVADENCCSLAAVRAEEYMWVCVCLFVCDVWSENVHLLDGQVYVMLLHQTDWVPQYVIFIMAYCPSWTLWHSVCWQ